MSLNNRLKRLYEDDLLVVEKAPRVVESVDLVYEYVHCAPRPLYFNEIARYFGGMISPKKLAHVVRHLLALGKIIECEGGALGDPSIHTCRERRDKKRRRPMLLDSEYF